MSYTPTEWKTGDVITAEKLNHLEGGVAGSAAVTTIDLSALPKPKFDGTTFEEIQVYLTSDHSDKALLCGGYLYDFANDDTLYKFKWSQEGIPFLPFYQGIVTVYPDANPNTNNVTVVEATTAFLFAGESWGGEYCILFPTATQFDGGVK